MVKNNKTMGASSRKAGVCCTVQYNNRYLHIIPATNSFWATMTPANGTAAAAVGNAVFFPRSPLHNPAPAAGQAQNPPRDRERESEQQRKQRREISALALQPFFITLSLPHHTKPHDAQVPPCLLLHCTLLAGLLVVLVLSSQRTCCSF